MPMVVMDPSPSPAAQGPTTPESLSAQDGRLVPQPYRYDTLTLAAGQDFETIVEATEPGVGWASRGIATTNVPLRDSGPRTSLEGKEGNHGSDRQ
jgi:FtsP/CotA-like multicopper oxidase with cupredoxin domain